ncbi:MAG: hypothetical protein JXP34_11795 [Planctomycetes bacterium]|nr:hypothetical protein [Planctomycetota bacterium]
MGNEMETPIGLNGIDFTSAALIRPGTLEVRRLSEIAGTFADAEAVREVLRLRDPVVFERRLPPDPPWSHLVYEVTILYPGRVGEEFMGTSGRCGADPALWVGLRGEGRVIRAPDEIVPVERGSVLQIEPDRPWRTVNVGRFDLVYLTVRSATRVEAAPAGAFRATVVAGPGGAPAPRARA